LFDYFKFTISDLFSPQAERKLILDIHSVFEEELLIRPQYLTRNSFRELAISTDAGREFVPGARRMRHSELRHDKAAGAA